jgi:hypothetical protein
MGQVPAIITGRTGLVGRVAEPLVCGEPGEPKSQVGGRHDAGRAEPHVAAPRPRRSPSLLNDVAAERSHAGNDVAANVVICPEVLRIIEFPTRPVEEPVGKFVTLVMLRDRTHGDRRRDLQGRYELAGRRPVATTSTDYGCQLP